MRQLTRPGNYLIVSDWPRLGTALDTFNQQDRAE